MSYDFNSAPYWDDFDEDKKFLRILFRPGVAVQTRELNQLQTILQNQVTRFGNHLFKDGSMIIPGQVSYDNEIGYIKLQNLNSSSQNITSFLSEFEGKTITGQTSGVKATVIKATPSNGTDPHTLHVKYINSGSSNTVKVFQNNEDIVSDATVPRSARLNALDATGIGSVASIQRGIYYIYGFFALVDTQTIVLDKYSASPNYRVGLTATESLITSDTDSSLTDNAQGSYNYVAPGAHRYKITLTLDKLSLNATTDNSFIELLRIEDGKIQYKIERTDYSELEKTLARRTFDESGNYTVRPFNIQIKEHRNNNRGAWVTGRAYLAGDIVEGKYTAKNSGTSGATKPIHTYGESSDGGVTWTYTASPAYNQGVYDALDTNNPGDESKLAIGLEPGKAYVHGYEIEKIATTYVTVPKARDFARVNDTKTSATVGNYIIVQNLFSVPETLGQYPTIELYDKLTATGGTSSGTKVGTARIRGLEKHDGTTYKAFLFDVKMNSGKVFERHVKQLFYNNTIFDFTADVTPVLEELTGSVSSSGTALTGNGTKFTTELIVGDYIQIGTNKVRVTAIADNNNATLETSLTATNSVAYRIVTQYLEPHNQPLLFPLEQYAIRKIRSSDDVAYGTSYTVSRNFGQYTAASGSFTINLSVTGETFGSTAIASNYLVVNTATGAVATPTISLTSSTSATFSGLTAGASYYVIGTVNKAGAAAKEKTKTLVTFETKDFTTSDAASAPTLSLGKADIIRVRNVMMATSFGAYSATNAVDITDRYTLDNGQRDTHYDIGNLILKSGQAAPTGTVRIIFDYFTHGAGDYFSVDSYAGVIEYKNIPVELRDVYDFRPRIDDTGSNFTGTNSSITALPKRGIDIEADYSYYLPRKDKICVDQNGNFFDISGTSALIPAEPADPSLGMVLHKLYIQPYTTDTSSGNVAIETINNKRYTMRDIGALESRIQNIEYYTALSLLEQETKSLSIQDEFGLERFKNGFIVDDFSGQGIGNVLSPDYRCSIDMENNTMRPFFSMDNIRLVEKNANNSQRAADQYAITGDLITLPYTHVEAIKQPYASRWENVNPFAVFTFIGNISLNPASDDWFETLRRPDIVINREGNFNAISTIAEKSGVLGTVWNSWQTQWTGASRTSTETLQYGSHTTTVNRYVNGVYVGTRNRVAGEGLVGNTGMQRTLTTSTTATDLVQSRTGVRTTLVAKIDTQQIADRTLSTAAIPYIRSRSVLFTARGLKPNTRFYPYFDNISISSYITPATVITYTEIAGFSTNFDYWTNVGSVSNETARLINGNPDSSLNRGDVITDQNTGATAVVAYTEKSSTGVMKVYVVNVIGTFGTGNVIVGSHSAARGTISAISVGTAGGNLVSNFSGDIVGLFNIPNSDSIKFRTGIREFKLTDSAANGSDFTSQGAQQYRAQGLLETKQATIVATRNAEFAYETVSENRTITETSSRVVADTGWSDPLAQTFMVQQPGGMFITKVDVFFKTRDAQTFLPVKMEIREVVNGYPGKKVLPFSRVIKSWNDVNVSDDATAATTFTFESPVYLQDATEYCIVLLSDSNNYNVWISQIGEKNVGTDRFISEQPYAGVLFKSQNASTWSADQLQDLKFTIHRASFTTGVNAMVRFVNDKTKSVVLDSNPILTTNGSNIVRVYHRNHGLFAGSTVAISGLASGTYNGIPSGQLNGNHIVSNVDFDSYTFTTSTFNANATGLVGGNAVTATSNIRFDSIQPSIQNQKFPDTDISFEVKSTDLSYASDTVDVIVNENHSFNTPRVVLSSVNEGLSLSNEKSLQVIATMITNNESVSPVIDIQRNSAVLINNRIDNPSTSLNVAAVDDRVIATSSANVTFDATNDRITTANATLQAAFKTVKVGTYLTIAGAVTGTNNGSFLVTSVASDGSYIGLKTDIQTDTSTSVTLTNATKFIDEIAPVNGSASSKYVSKEINLQNSSTYFKIMYAYNRPQESDIKVYYKTVPVGSVTPVDQINYTLLPPPYTLVPSSNPNQFNDIEYNVTGLEPFNAIMVKIVYTSTNTAAVPRIQDLRIIACA